MIKEKQLKLLLQKYGIKYKKNMISNYYLSRRNYNQIEEYLNYLLNELKIDKKNIENCMTVLFVNNIYQIKRISQIILNEKELGLDVIIQCPSILAQGNAKELEQKIKYIKTKLGLDVIKKCPSVLLSGDIKSMKEIIEYIEPILGIEFIKKCPSILFQSDISNIKKILYLLVKKYNLGQIIKGTTFMKSADNIEKVLELADKEGILPYINSSVLGNSYIEFAAKIQFLKSNGIPLVQYYKLNSIFSMGNLRLNQVYGISKKELVDKFYGKKCKK